MKNVESVMEDLTNQDLIEIYSNLNNWEWDYRLGSIPEDWDYMPDFNLSKSHTMTTKRDVINPYMTYIKSKITEKEWLKHHHLTSRGMTRFQHEVWWIKKRLSEIFNVGWHSKKNKRMMAEMLRDIAVEHTQSKLKDTYKN